MKIYINKYRNHWLSPYTIMENVLFYKKWTDPDFDLYDDANEKYTNWLVKPCRVLLKFLDIVHPKIDYVKIDKWDTWSMDHTLAKIVLPMLKQLKETKHGSALVDEEDVPEHLRATSTPEYDSQLTFDFYSEVRQEKDVDYEITHKRWDYVLDEMIFAFEHLVDDSWEDAYRSGEHDMAWIPIDEKGNEVPKGEHKYFRMDKGPNDTYKCDYDAIFAVEKRMSNGFRLFGKYYRGLWD
jgi:hypothetical protein